MDDDAVPEFIEPEHVGITNATTLTLAAGNPPSAPGSLYYFNGEFFLIDSSGLIQLTASGGINATPVAISRTASDELTHPMYMIDHRLAKQERPPQLPELFDEDDTEVDCELPHCFRTLDTPGCDCAACKLMRSNAGHFI